MRTSEIDLRHRAKLNAALVALDYVEDGMILGLGSGSTAEAFIAALGERVRQTGLRVQGVATSASTERAAIAAGVALIPIERADRVDVAIDGADEIDPVLDLIKGGGGCLLREKIVADAADLFVVIADSAKRVERLGAFPLPVEVEPFGFTVTAKRLFDAMRNSGCDGDTVNLRANVDGAPFRTDGGHLILDCACGRIDDPYEFSARLRRIPGVIGHGLFLDMASVCIIGAADGAEVLERR